MVTMLHGHCVNHSAINKIGHKFISPRAVITTPVPVTFPFSGKPLAGMVINVPMVTVNSVDDSLAGTRVYVGTLPTSDAVFTVKRITALGIVSTIGIITITSASQFSAVLSGGGASLSVGDVLQLVAPAVQDATLADVGITILTMREE
jgi:hypothetical protein